MSHRLYHVFCLRLVLRTIINLAPLLVFLIVCKLWCWSTFPRNFFAVDCGWNIIPCADLLFSVVIWNLFNWRKKLIIPCKNVHCSGIAFSRHVVIVRFEILCWGFRPSRMWCCFMGYEVLDGSWTAILHNVDKHPSNDTSSHPRKLQSILTLNWIYSDSS